MGRCELPERDDANGDPGVGVVTVVAWGAAVAGS